MFDVGFWEMAFIGVIALIVIGPERLPGVARNVGMWVGKARRMINEVKSDVKREMKEYDLEQVKAFKSELDEASKNLNDVTKSTSASFGLKEAAEDIKKSVEGVSDSINKETAAINQAVKKKTVAKTTPRKKAPKKKPASAIKVSTKRVSKKAEKKPRPVKQAARNSNKSKVSTKKLPKKKVATRPSAHSPTTKSKK